MVDVNKKISKDMDKLIKKKLSNKLVLIVDEIKQAIIEEYDDELINVVTDRKSKTNPNLYRDEFIERLDEFPYIEDIGDSLSISVPDMNSFDFSGRLKVIETIMQGAAGVYVEINEEDYITVFGKKPINEDPLDRYVPPKEKIYLVRYTSKIQKAERGLGKRLVRYPFSNTPPINILEVGEIFVENNMDRWIKDALEEAQKEFVKVYKGARL